MVGRKSHAELNAFVIPVFWQPLSSRIASTTLYHHFDAIGSTRQLTNAARAETDIWIFDAWGVPVTRAGTTDMPAAWIGQVGYYTDKETGVLAIRLRIYGTTTSRWHSKDLLERLGVDVSAEYVYANNSPVIVVDPSGGFPDQPPAASPKKPRTRGCGDLATGMVPKGNDYSKKNASFRCREEPGYFDSCGRIVPVIYTTEEWAEKACQLAFGVPGFDRFAFCLGARRVVLDEEREFLLPCPCKCPTKSFEATFGVRCITGGENIPGRVSETYTTCWCACQINVKCSGKSTCS